MTARRITRKNSGFTLIEILIVVIILGILAAIVIPQFTSASNDARNSSTASQLQTLRSQIELYKIQHNDTLPDLATSNWAALTGKTLVDGTATTTSGTGVFGPYLQQVPVNPLTNHSPSVVTNGTAAATGSDFVYDYGTSGSGTGNIKAMTAAGALSNY